MVTDAPSLEEPFSSFLGKLRSAFVSTTALRTFIILSFFLYESPFLRRLASGEDWLRLPLWDVGWVDDSKTFVFLEGVYLCSSVLACFSRFVVPGCLVAGTASILLVVLDLTYRLQFAFLPGTALLAIGLTELLRRTEGAKKRTDLPLVLLLGSIYGFASFHKFLNFHWMTASLPSDVFSAPGATAPALCASEQSPLLAFVAWTVVPYEALLTVLVLMRRWLKLRLLCVSLFHWILIILVPFIWHVALFMLSLNFYLAALQKPSARQRMFVDRNWYVFTGAEALFIVAYVMASSIPGAAGILVGAIAFANLVLFPLFFLLWPFWRGDNEPVVASSLRLSGSNGAIVTAYGALLLTFGFSPLMLEKQYSVRSLGWSMFAGGEFRDGSYYTMTTPASPCFNYPIIYGMIWCEAKDKQLQYLSFRKSDLERLKKYFERRSCGGPPLQIVTARF
jgi:hypothetical protein